MKSLLYFFLLICYQRNCLDHGVWGRSHRDSLQILSPICFRSLGMGRLFHPRSLGRPRWGGSVCKALATEGSVTPAGLGHADWRDGQSDNWRCTHPCCSVIWASGDEVWVPEQWVIHIPHHPCNQLAHIQPRRRGSIGHVCAILRPSGKGRVQFRRGW